MRMQRFGNEQRHDDRRQHHQRRQGGAKIVRRQTEFANVLCRQTALVLRRMPDGMRPRRQLGEEEDGNEKKMAQRIHEPSLVGFDDNQSTWTSNPLRYSPSGKLSATGWSAAPARRRTMRASRPASCAAPATIFWNNSSPMPPEHE